ncbi:MAG: hypothetical protein PHO10_00015 [Gemmiger sp.]|nr:hypothetical protein [Gemmiger sp.]
MPDTTHTKRCGPACLAGALLLVCCVAVMVKTLFVGLEIDEEYALSIGYRLVQGDTLFYTMWEPHQLSALTAAGLIALFMAVTGGTTGVLLFVRVVMLGAKALLSWVFYREFRPSMGKTGAYLAALVLFVYTPKWFLGPDYIAQQFHYTLAAFLFFYDYYSHNFRRPWQLLPGAVCLSLSFLAFPQSIFAAPVFFVGTVVLGRRRKEPRFLALPRGAWLLVLGCLLSAAAFIGYVCSGLTPATLASRAALILNDPQYSFTTAQRLALLASQAANVVDFAIKPMALALAVAAGGCLWGVWQRRVRHIRYWLNFFFALWCGLTLVLCLVRAVRDASLDERYFCPVLVLAGAWFFWGGKGTAREPLFWLGYLPGVVAYLFILRSTLLGLGATFMYLSWPALCGVVALCLQGAGAQNVAGNGQVAENGQVADNGHVAEKGQVAENGQAAQNGQMNGPENGQKTAPYALPARWGQGLLLAFLAFLVVCRALLVLTTGWPPATMWNTPLRYLADGPAAGTWADAATADRYAALTLALAGRAGDKVLLSTGDVDGLAYLMEDGTLEVGQASVISSTDSDTRFAAYYNELPDKKPDVIVYNLDSVRELSAFHAWLESNLTITARYPVTVGSARFEVLEVQKGG